MTKDMETVIEAKDNIIRTQCKVLMAQMTVIALKVLPNADSYGDVTEKMICSISGMPGTFEWFSLKTSCIDYEYMSTKELTQIINEWDEYLKPYILSYCDKNGIELPNV